MNLKSPSLIFLTLMTLAAPPALSAGESPSNPSLIGILYKQFDAIKTLFVEHQARVQTKLDQFQAVLDAPSPDALKGAEVGVQVGNWAGNTPDNLENAHDGDANSPTGWGITTGAGNVGHYVIDFKKVRRGTVKMKVGLLSDAGKRVAVYTVWGSQDGMHWFKTWETDGWHLPGEYILDVTTVMETRWVKFQAHDIGEGRAWARIFDVSFYESK